METYTYKLVEDEHGNIQCGDKLYRFEETIKYGGYMKIIDLLNKIANGEEVPKKIRITDIDDRITRHYNFFYDEDDQEYKDDELFPLGARLILDRVLNKKVEILDKIEEEKKIPEKLEQILSKRGKYNSIDELAEEVFKAFETIDDLIINQNQLIDYLKSKGE